MDSVDGLPVIGVGSDRVFFETASRARMGKTNGYFGNQATEANASFGARDSVGCTYVQSLFESRREVRIAHADWDT
jgi:hypothetical protein